MTESTPRARRTLNNLLATRSEEQVKRDLAPHFEPPTLSVASPMVNDVAHARARLTATGLAEDGVTALLDGDTVERLESYHANIEALVGTVKVPVGLAGPLRINGTYLRRDMLVPLATHEAALVSSYHRGALAITDAGGCTAIMLNEGVSRAPGFVFDSVIESGAFVHWAVGQLDAFREAAESTTSHGELLDMQITVEGNHVYLIFEYATGDAAGQNMVTIATQAVCNHILQHTPVLPRRAYVEANLSGDKKASALSYMRVRGKKVTCEVRVPADVLRARLSTTAEEMTEYWRVSAIGGVLSGTIGVQGHYANGLAALFLACGQDVACVSEAAVGVTRFEELPDGALYAAVTLPNLIVGTVGGGTGLPSQRACLEIVGLSGSGHAFAFAELCAGIALAGELSIIAALASGDFTRAHEVLARRRLRRQSGRSSAT